jgi:hypothetical protein
VKAALQRIKQHPFSVIFYILYFAFFISQTLRELDVQRILKQNNGNWPYGVREWAGIPVYLFGIIFLIITIICGSAKHENGSFYIWLG